MSCLKEDNSKTDNQESVKIKTINEARFFKLTKRTDHETFLFYFIKNFEKRLTSLCTIAFNRISLKDHAKFLKTKSKYTITQLKERILKDYHEKIDVFVRKNVDELTEHRKKDHEINLKSESEISYVQNYRSMCESKLEAIRHYLNEHLTKNFIRSSTSKASTSILIIKKSESGLCICVNYRALNAVTEKSRYFISLINETLVKLSKVAIFIKLNVIHAFNRIRIKEEHE